MPLKAQFNMGVRFLPLLNPPESRIPQSLSLFSGEKNDGVAVLAILAVRLANFRKTWVHDKAAPVFAVALRRL
jgi:hypothetical protein